MNEEEPVEFPIGDEIDLHTFRPSEIGELLPEVESYQLAGAGSGSWGATWVYLRRPDAKCEPTA